MIKSTTSPALKIIPLGGLKEIGKNTWVFEINDEIMLLDGGLSFPEEGMPGVNIVLPDMTYLRENKHKIKGMIVTHGHEDHIGGIAFHLKQFEIPVIYGPRLAMALLEDKLAEAGVSNRTELRRVLPRDVVRVGSSFFVEFMRNTHSIADSFSVAINTPAGMVIHSGDFKFDHTPVDGEFFDFQRLAEHGEKGVLCLISDSTNAEVPGTCPSERSVYPNLERYISTAPGRVILTTFASSVHRLQMVLEIAQKTGRIVSVLGRSMLNVIAHARNLGYIKCRDDLFQPLQNLRHYRNDQILILTTGSQGEPNSALTRIANESHSQLKIIPGDTVIFSASPIPGNVIPVVRTIDKLIALGANVIYGKEKGIHVSGHGCQEDHKLMLGLVRPKFFFPAHGELRMLKLHAKMAEAMGIPAQNIVIAENGDVVEVSQSAIRIVDKVPAGIELIDASREGVVKGDVLKDRRQISEDGVITVAVSVTGDGKLYTTPDLHTNGVVSLASKEELLSLVNQTVEQALRGSWDNFVNGLAIDWVGLRQYLEREISKLLRQKMQGRPVLVLLLQTPPGQALQPMPQVNGSGNGKPVLDVARQNGRRRRSAATV
ncbi:MAG: ribonuclease J [Cyanobacteria bacterium M5B4]|nr:ribonuclease J [Cyanobacteria bacterium KgW148]PLS68691.1 MAG: ribonuclease J [Cyanobacteria bacterium M5B4]